MKNCFFLSTSFFNVPYAGCAKSISLSQIISLEVFLVQPLRDPIYLVHCNQKALKTHWERRLTWPPKPLLEAALTIRFKSMGEQLNQAVQTVARTEVFVRMLLNGNTRGTGYWQQVVNERIWCLLEAAWGKDNVLTYHRCIYKMHIEWGINERRRPGDARITLWDVDCCWQMSWQHFGPNGFLLIWQNQTL